MIHRDLKPENIVIMDYDDLTSIKLIDFGLAVKSTKSSIQDYAKCGTLLYTPPEQVLNNFAYAKVNIFRQLTHPVSIESGYVGCWHNNVSVDLRGSSFGRVQL